MVFAQETVPIEWKLEFQYFSEGENNLGKDLPDQWPKHLKAEDSLQLIKKAQGWVGRLREEGYLAANLDRIIEKGRGDLWAELYLGNNYQWANLDAGNVPEAWLAKSGYREKLFRGQKLRSKQVNQLMKNLLDQAQNNGYPFSSIHLDSLELVMEEEALGKSSLKASLRMTRGPLIRFDSISVPSNLPVRKSFLMRELGIHPGDPYSERKVLQIRDRIKEIPYLSLDGDPELYFRNEMAEVRLPLRYIRANSIDGFIGFLPNEGSEGSLLINGELNLDLYNLFQSGKNMHLAWQRFQTQSQVLDFELYWAKAFGTGLDIIPTFNLLREDTSFLNTHFSLGFEREFRKGNRLMIYPSWRNTRVLREQRDFNPSLPETDFSIRSLGLRWQGRSLDDLLVPMRGYRARIGAEVGQKELLEMSQFPEELENTIEQQSLQAFLTLDVQYYFSLYRRWFAYTRIAGAHLFNDNLFRNDLFRLGGLQSIRGFNENHFFASSYAFTNLEIRFFLDTDSYLLILYDQMWMEHATVTQRFDQWVSGFGGGLSLKTPAGMFSMIYALGASRDRPLDFRFSRLHFGLINRF